MEKLYEGKAKIIYKTKNPEEYVIYFKDDATAFNNQKKAVLENKGILNNKISTLVFQLLETKGVPTHFIKKISDREILAKKVRIIPLEVIIRNRIAGSFAKRYGLTEGGVLPTPVIEYSYKNDALGDPLMPEEHVYALQLAVPEEMQELREMAFKINRILKDFFLKCQIILVDFKVEFGRTEDGRIILADEISPDSCRFWDSETGEKLDKDRFRRDLGKIIESYEEVFHRMEAQL